MSLDQEYDADLAAVWQRLEEQLVAAANRGVVPVNFQPTQYCLNSQTQNLRQPLAVMEGEGPQEELPLELLSRFMAGSVTCWLL